MTSPCPPFDLDEVKETLNFLTDWEDKYAYIIDLGKKLPPYPDALQNDAHLVPGCTSRVWLTHAVSDTGHLHLFLKSDALIVQGLLAILYALYEGRSLSALAALDAGALFAELGLEQHLSPNRRNGFFSVAGRIGSLGQKLV